MGREKKKSDELKKKSKKDSHKADKKSKSKSDLNEGAAKSKHAAHSADGSKKEKELKSTQSDADKKSLDAIYLPTVWGIDKLIREFEEKFPIAESEAINKEIKALEEKINKAFNNNFDAAFTFVEQCLPASGLPIAYKDRLTLFQNKVLPCVSADVINTKIVTLLSDAKIVVAFTEHAEKLKQDLIKLVSQNPSDLILQDKMKLLSIHMDSMSAISGCYGAWMVKSMRIVEFLDNLSKCLAKPTTQPSVAAPGSAGQFARPVVNPTQTTSSSRETPSAAVTPQGKK